jgi:hypothetical protein
MKSSKIPPQLMQLNPVGLRTHELDPYMVSCLEKYVQLAPNNVFKNFAILGFWFSASSEFDVRGCQYQDKGLFAWNINVIGLAGNISQLLPCNGLNGVMFAYRGCEVVKA